MHAFCLLPTFLYRCEMTLLGSIQYTCSAEWILGTLENAVHVKENTVTNQHFLQSVLQFMNMIAHHYYYIIIILSLLLHAPLIHA